ncbi:helix-turn-helix domain-containing protein [Haloimpatiens lingqiaonensis]|uniref:helix-turn-helix domain-containing protein n=1 Tax=Haloimpatiens lingqiaonensis TaxID=1380675 RepID=UPI0010FE375E|nr:helix-turn-helix transcriptional regulator [Haloimpatiens lingqiaonensis]
MEILSRGEKIKRARIYKGLTLKDVCGDKISVSKLSCVENDKIDLEDDVLTYIAEKLDLELEYLKQDVKEQLDENFQLLKEGDNLKNREEKIKYNLKVAINHKFYDKAFSFMNILFNYYIDEGILEKVQFITSDYYDLYQKAYSDKNRIIYYLDMSRYCFANKEYRQAINFYSNVKKFLILDKKLKKQYLVISTYNEIVCYIMLKEYDKAYEISKELAEIVELEKDEKKKAEIYHLLAMMCLRGDCKRFEEYKQKANKLYGHNDNKKATALYNYAVTMFRLNQSEKAVEYVKEAIKYFPKHDKFNLVRFLLGIVQELSDNNVLDFGREICDEALDYAIEVDKIEFIEKAYYYKAKILSKLKEEDQAEIYMNLCLDSLVKFGNNKELYERYLEMGYMYYNLGNTIDSIKYFDLALKMEKKI